MLAIEKQDLQHEQQTALIICNGDPPPEELLQQLWQKADYRVAADGGANHLLSQQLLPDAVVGDFDSLQPEVRKKLADSTLFLLKEQETNDADKAVRHCLKRGYKVINILGADGGRLDQFLASLEILFKYSPEARLILWSPLERMEFIQNTWEENLKPGTTLSLLPLFGGAQGVITQGLEFPLNNKDLLPGKTPSGVSNLVVSNPVTVTLNEGQLLLIIQHADKYSTDFELNQS